MKHEIDHAYTPDEATRLAEGNEYNMVIINSMYGEEEWISALPDEFFDRIGYIKKKGCAVVSYSGLSLEGQMRLWEGYVKEGVPDHYISKTNPIELIDMIKKEMEKQRYQSV